MTEIDIKTLIGQSIDALEKKDALALRKISGQANSEAAIEGHRELILLALVDYSLSKILSKVHYEDTNSGFYSKILKKFKDAQTAEKEKMIHDLEDIEDLVIKLDKKEGHFEDNVIDKAKIKKAAKLYEQGLSLRRAAELTGAEPVEVLDYVGGSKIHEFEGGGKNARRLKKAREVFK